jgi:soluble lytic murein transglycosylase-like protein
MTRLFGDPRWAAAPGRVASRYMSVSAPRVQRRSCRTVIGAAITITVAAAAAGCTGGSESPSATDRSSTSSTSSTSRATAAPPQGGAPAGSPAPDAPIRDDSAWAADTVTRTDRALDQAIDAWRAGGAPARGEPPQSVVLPALYLQRIYRFLARHPALARRTVARLRAPLAAEVKDNVTAVRDLVSLTNPVRNPNAVRTQRPLPAGTLLGYFQRAGRRFEISWQVLAAIMLVETKFGRVKSSSSAGAQGPMQFLPATWKAYGLGGDIHDPRDAVMGAANYLDASGAPGDYARAVHAYNPDRRYVDAVLRHARQIRRDPRAFYAYYNWQVFVVTTRGDVRRTGPPPL